MNVKFNYLSIFFLPLLFIFLSCATALPFEEDDLDDVKKVAVIIYTVPAQIIFLTDARKNRVGVEAFSSKSKKIAEGNGKRAATLAHKAFIEELNKQGLKFEVISLAEMAANKTFMSLDHRHSVESDGQRNKNFGRLCVGPEGFNSFGPEYDWPSESEFFDNEEERNYIKASIAALKVDAALLINDYGYSFSCRSCTDIHGEMTGAASTGSAFLATMVDKDGDAIFSITDWFDKTDGKAAMVSNIVNPLSHDALFRAHGVKMAQVWAAALNKKIEKANN